MELVAKRFNELSLDEYHELLKLRCAVFLVEQQSPYQEVDDADKEAIHLYFRNDEGGACRLRAGAAGRRHAPDGLHRARHRLERGCGAGRRIMEEAIRVAQEELDADVITIEAQVQARGFYEKLGFVQTSDEFDDGGVMHIEMRLMR